MRIPFFAGNWKMNLGPSKARELAAALREGCQDLSGVDIAVAPPFISLPAVIETLRGSRISVAAQNCHWEASGAFTGEVAAEMVREIGCSHVIIGHSERRQFFGETDDGVNRKLMAVLRVDLHPIVCVGETLQEREAKKTLEVVRRQLTAGLKGISAQQMAVVTVAYEPVWAIGTGKVATPQQAQEVHAFLRGLLAELYGSAVSRAVRIQYGGSVKPGNIKDLMGQPDIDGALVGGASLEVASFLGILKYRT